MACSKCKKKEKLDFIEKEISKYERPLIIGMSIFSALALFGVYQLLIKIFSLF